MDNMKITANQPHRVTQSQSGAKERDEGFVAAQVDANKAKHEAAPTNSSNDKAQHAQEASEDHSQKLIEQRKRALAEQLSERDKAREQSRQNEELSAQRKIESRAAANREKIKDSYDAVSHSDNQARSEKTAANESKAESSDNNKDPINLVV